MQGNTTRLVKIGFSKDPIRRLNDCQIGSPDQLKLLAWKFGSIISERGLHGKFSEYHSHGEWYSPHQDILDCFMQDGIFVQNEY